MDATTLAMFGLPGGTEWIIIGVVALLIFGRRLPDVARSVGKSIVEFKRGLRDVKDEIDVQSKIDSTPEPKLENKSEPAGESTADAPSPKETTPAPK